MARVFERPRYRNQARNKLVAIAAGTHDIQLKFRIGTRLGLSTASAAALKVDYDEAAEMIMEMEGADVELPSHDTQLEQYLLDARIGAIDAHARLMTEPGITRVASDLAGILDFHKPEKIYNDEYAAFDMVGRALLDPNEYARSNDSIQAMEAAKFFMQAQAAGQKIGPAAIKMMFDRDPDRVSYTVTMAKYDRWVEAAESLEFRSTPLWVKACRLAAIGVVPKKRSLRELAAKAAEAPVEERYKIAGMSSIFPDSHSYNINGVYLMFLGNILYIMDSSSADYLRVSFTSMRNAAFSLNCHRISGDNSARSMGAHFLLATQLIGQLIRPGNISDTEVIMNARYIARHMHLCYTRWQNLVGEDTARIDCGYKERDVKLREEYLGYYPNTDVWWDFVMSRPISERERGELFKLYHFLPPPDIDALQLHSTFTTKAMGENACSGEAITQFIKFCSAYHVARFLHKNRHEPKVKCSEGYVPANMGWWKSCLSGKFAMPPRADWGKVQMFRHYPFDFSGDYHVFSAKDSTRVVADSQMYMDRKLSRSMPRKDNNELLSAIFNGEKMSNGEYMHEWRDRVFRKDLTSRDEIIAAEAGKAENTKPGHMVRETLSACDTAREIFTEVEQALRPLSMMTPGVSVRMDLVRHKRKYQTMAASLSRGSTKYAIATSTDVSGWSPRMPRRMFHAWQEYALSTTECPDPTAIRNLWDRLHVFVDRRGIKGITPLDKGNIQGWPATSDTTMHAMILVYWAYECREQKIISSKELAYTLCLIDDAATVVVLEGGKEEAFAKAAKARELLKSMYKDLGFSMDDIKSFFSSTKFVYLNELYWDGAQVCHASKTMMKIDRDFARRFATLPDRIAAAQGGAASAASQGADPFAAYLLSSWMSFRWAFRSNRMYAKLPVDQQALVMMTPVGMNGLGARTMTAVFATGSNDTLTWFLEIAYSLLLLTPNVALRKSLSGILDQEPAEVSAIAAASNPFGYTVEDHKSAAWLTKEKFRSCARDMGMAEPFKSLDKIERSEAMEVAMKAILEATQSEAGVLEEVMSSMPHSFVDQVMSRVDKSELIAAMLGSRGIGTLRRAVASAERANFEFIIEAMLSSESTASAEALQAEGSYKTAIKMRDAMYARSGFKILNHTYPCPFALWGYVASNRTAAGVEIVPGTEIASMFTTTVWNERRLMPTLGSRGVNLYDSRMTQIGYKGYRTAGGAITEELKIGMANPVKRKIAAGLSALRWASANGSHHVALETLFVWAWGGHMSHELRDIVAKLPSGNVKRLSMRHSKTNHTVAIFPNVQGSATIDASAVRRKQAGTHHMYDVMAAITSLRCATLLEAAAHMVCGETEIFRAFSYLEAAHVLLEVPDAPEKEVNVDVIRAITPFVDLDTPLAKHARVLTNPNAMAALSQEYLAAGARAADKTLKAMIEEDVADYESDKFYAQETVLVRAMVQSRTYDDFAAARAHLFAHEARRAKKGGIVATDDKARSSAQPSHDTVAALDTNAAARLAGKAFVGSRSRSIAISKPRWAVLCHEAWKANHIEDITSEEGWDKVESTILLNNDDIGAFVREVLEIYNGSDFAGIASSYLAGMGIPGFRSHITDAGMSVDQGGTDVFRQAMASFLGRGSSVDLWIQALGKEMSKLTHATSDEYSNTTTIGASVPSHAASEVLKAQWAFNGAKYALRADRMMEAKKSGKEVALLNCRGAYLSCAVSALTGTGNLRKRVLYEKILDKQVASCIKNIKNSDGDAEDADKFTAVVEEEELELADEVSNVNDLCKRLTHICSVANSHGGRMDGAASARAAREVVEWVEADVQGLHKDIVVKSKHAKEVLNIEPVVPEPVEAAPPVTREPVAPSAWDLSGVVGEVTAPENVDYAPNLMYEWLFTSGMITDDMVEAEDAEEAIHLYRLVTTSRDRWNGFIRKHFAGQDWSEVADVYDSSFEAPEWDEEDGGGEFVA